MGGDLGPRHFERHAVAIRFALLLNLESGPELKKPFVLRGNHFGSRGVNL